jgi:hypothetical protein
MSKHSRLDWILHQGDPEIKDSESKDRLKYNMTSTSKSSSYVTSICNIPGTVSRRIMGPVKVDKMYPSGRASREAANVASMAVIGLDGRSSVGSVALRHVRRNIFAFVCPAASPNPVHAICVGVMIMNRVSNVFE